MEWHDSGLLRRLERPVLPVDVVLDTDTYNEIDDQYALAYLLKKSAFLKTKAIYAAPFLNYKSSSPADGMEKSYCEIMKILKLMGRGDLNGLVHKGSEYFLKNSDCPVSSPAAYHLAALAARYTPQHPLYVVAIGAITNVASALIMNPAIAEKMVVIWLGGHGYHWKTDKYTPLGSSLNREFNLSQDVLAAKVVFGCGVALVQLPCMGVVSSFRTTGPELEYWLKGKNQLCDYLVDTTICQSLHDKGRLDWSRAIWDVTAVGWLLDEKFQYDRLVRSPIPEADHYIFSENRHPIRSVYYVDRDALFEDLFRVLAE